MQVIKIPLLPFVCTTLEYLSPGKTDKNLNETNTCFEEVCRQYFFFKSNNWTRLFRHMWQNECLQWREMRSFLLPIRPLCLPSLITCHTQPDSRFNWFRVFVTGAAQHHMSSSLSSYSTQSAWAHCTSIISAQIFMICKLLCWLLTSCILYLYSP